MLSIISFMERQGRIVRRRDLMDAGFTDAQVRSCLGSRQIFRVRHGWYALQGTSDTVVHVLRVGGRLTGLAALATLPVFLPAPRVLDIVVPRGAAGLRDPHDRRKRLGATEGLRVHWIDSARYDRAPSDWRASEDDALLCVLRHESREIAVSCCDALVRYCGWSHHRLARAFALAPERVQRWLDDVDGRADAWGETVVRIRARDAGIPFDPQPEVAGVGRLDGRVTTRTYVEVDGMQHSQDWNGPSSFEGDHDRDIRLLALTGAHTIRVTYRQIEQMWPECLAAIRRAYLDDVAAGIR